MKNRTFSSMPTYGEMERIKELTFDGMIKKSDREKAIEWWNGFPDFATENVLKGGKHGLCTYYFQSRSYQNLTGREIEQIWRKETQQEKEEITQVDFEMFNQLQHKRVEFGQIYLSAKEMDNIKLFFELLSKSSTFAHKAHEELNKLNK